MATDFETFYRNGLALDSVRVDSKPVVRIFYGFSGPPGLPGGFDTWARRAGAAAGVRVDVVMGDIVNDMDLADELVWERILRELVDRRGFQASLWSPP